MYVMYLLWCGQSDNMNLALNNRWFFFAQPWGPDLAAWPRLGSRHVVEWTMPWHVAGDFAQWIIHRIGLWENLQESPIFDGKNHGFL